MEPDREGVGGRHGMRARSWFVRGTVAALVLAAAGWVLLQRHESAQARERGAALHEGRAAVPGLLVGLETALPTLATRCVNCHEGAAALGGVLDARRLTEPQPRRGGPSTRYDLAAFCQLLRTGIDPAQVIIDTSMPRFDITEHQCKDLWTFLTSR